MNNMQTVIKKIRKQLTWFDYILIILGTIGLIVFVLMLRREDRFIDIRVKVTDPNPLFITTQPVNEYAFGFQKGDTQRNELGQVVAEITSVDSYRTDPQALVVYLNIHVKANYNPRKKTYTIQGRPVLLGQTLTFAFQRVKVETVVIAFPGFESRRKDQTIRVKTQIRDANRTFSDIYGVPQFFADAIKTGDEMKDSQGNVLARIIEVTSFPAKRTVVVNGGSQVISDQELKDVYFTIELQVVKIRDRFYMLDYIPVLIGDSIPLNFSTFSIWPTIITIEAPVQ